MEDGEKEKNKQKTYIKNKSKEEECGVDNLLWTATKIIPVYKKNNKAKMYDKQMIFKWHRSSKIITNCSKSNAYLTSF